MVAVTDKDLEADQALLRFWRGHRGMAPHISGGRGFGHEFGRFAHRHDFAFRHHDFDRFRDRDFHRDDRFFREN